MILEYHHLIVLIPDPTALSIVLHYYVAEDTGASQPAFTPLLIVNIVILGESVFVAFDEVTNDFLGATHHFNFLTT